MLQMQNIAGAHRLVGVHRPGIPGAGAAPLPPHRAALPCLPPSWLPLPCLLPSWLPLLPAPCPPSNACPAAEMAILRKANDAVASAAQDTQQARQILGPGLPQVDEGILKAARWGQWEQCGVPGQPGWRRAGTAGPAGWLLLGGWRCAAAGRPHRWLQSLAVGCVSPAGLVSSKMSFSEA